MGWIEKCCQTYDNFIGLMDYRDTERVPMAPMSHAIRFVDVVIKLDANGNFITASLRNRKSNEKTGVVADKPVAIPVSEASLARTSNGKSISGPLVERLLYLLQENDVSYEAYMQVLDDWIGFSNLPQLSAVRSYIKGNTILGDLASCGLSDKVNIKSVVAWDVVGYGPCWCDKGLMASWHEYYMDYLKRSGRRFDLCMATGTYGYVAEYHPKGVVSFSGNGKLISSKSEGNNRWTWRGRFTDEYQACTIGYEASQKAHNALAWLVTNHGIRDGLDSAVMLAWSSQGYELPRLTGFLSRKNDSPGRSFQSYRTLLREAVLGYKANVPKDADVVVMGIEAVSDGCLAITHYSEMDAFLYFDRFAEWEEYCCCNGFSPALGQFVQYGYGSLQNGKYVCKDKVYYRFLEELVFCRLNGLPFPTGLKENLVYHATKQCCCTNERDVDKNGSKGSSPREKLLRVACSAVRKHRYDIYKEEWEMKLDVTCVDRSYLYGRLLAVFEQIERHALEVKAKTASGNSSKKYKERETYAVMNQANYAMTPLTVLRQLHMHALPYFNDLKPGSRNYYRNLLDDIIGMMEHGEDIDDPLEDVYLLGYYEQRKALRQWSSKPSDGETVSGDTDDAEDREAEEPEEFGSIVNFCKEQDEE